MYEYFNGLLHDEEDSFLEHHGILGQKWGIRRFQNYDGTLKAAGKKRRSEDRVQKREERKAARAEKKEAKAQAKAEKAKADLEAAKKRAIANANLNEIMKLRGSMTTDELKEASARALAIGQVNKNMPKEKSKIDKVIDTLGTGKKAIDAIADAHQSLQSLRKEFGLDVKSILNDKDDGQMTIDDWANNKDPDIFDRIKSATGKIAKDAANKASEAYQQKKTEKQLKEASDRIKDNETLDWLKSVSGTKREENESNAEKQRKLQVSVSGHGKIDTGFKLKDGDYSIFSSSAARNTKVSDIPKPSTQTQKTIDRLIKKGSKTGDMTIDDLHAAQSDAIDKINKALGR